MTKFVLAFIGAAYLILAAWCVVQPKQTSTSVGFNLEPGGGQSEFLVVYGGLQTALGLMFLWPLFQSDFTRYSLILCLVLHGCLVVFRSVSFLTFTGIPTTTYALAAVEWVIFLLCLWRFFAGAEASSLTTVP